MTARKRVSQWRCTLTFKTTHSADRNADWERCHEADLLEDFPWMRPETRAAILKDLVDNHKAVSPPAPVELRDAR